MTIKTNNKALQIEILHKGTFEYYPQQNQATISAFDDHSALSYLK